MGGKERGRKREEKKAGGKKERETRGEGGEGKVRLPPNYNPAYVTGPPHYVKSNYFIVRPKVDQRAGSLPHLGIFAIHMR